MNSTWRKAARPIIAKVIAEVGNSDPVALRMALRETYPVGPHAYHPYKIWADEIKVQLGKKRPRGSQVKPLAGQGVLFDDSSQ